jgi:hypothetical protein
MVAVATYTDCVKYESLSTCLQMLADDMAWEHLHVVKDWDHCTMCSQVNVLSHAIIGNHITLLIGQSGDGVCLKPYILAP